MLTYCRLSSCQLAVSQIFCLCLLLGCTQQLLDSTRMLSMQEDAYCHRISSEVMKHCLYKPAAPCRRRISSRLRHANQPARAVLSLPVTPGYSSATTPALSPTSSISCTAFSCSVTPRASSPETQDIDNHGLANVLTPVSRYVRASCSEVTNTNKKVNSPDSVFLNVPTISGQFFGHKRLSGSVHV